MTSRKLQALDALANAPSAAPGERENAARAAAAIRAKLRTKRVLRALAQQPRTCAAHKANGTCCLAPVKAGIHCGQHATAEEQEQLLRGPHRARTQPAGHRGDSTPMVWWMLGDHHGVLEFDQSAGGLALELRWLQAGEAQRGLVGRRAGRWL